MNLLMHTGQGLGPAQDRAQTLWRDQKDLALLLYLCSAPLALFQAGAAVCKGCLLMIHCSRSGNRSLDFTASLCGSPFTFFVFLVQLLKCFFSFN